MNNHGAGIEDLISPLKERMEFFKQRMELSEEENRVLKTHLAQARQELAELKRGIGISVYVAGKPVPTGSAGTSDAQAANGGAPLPNARPFAAPANLNERRPPDVASLGQANQNPQGFHPLARQNAGNTPDAGSVDAQGRPNGRNANIADYFLDY